MPAWLSKLKHELHHAITRPGAQLTRGQRFLKFCYDLTRHARYELRDANAKTMAAALTYRTIFGLVPMIVMALILFRAFGGFEGSQEGLTQLVYQIFDVQDAIAQDDTPPRDEPAKHQAPDPGDSDADAAQTDPTDPTTPTTTTTPEPPKQKLSWFGKKIESSKSKAAPAAAPELDTNAALKERVDSLIGQLSSTATSINIGSIGVVGTLLLIWAALGLIVTVEKTFNLIFNAPLGRPWHVRIPIYWAVITLGPVLIWGSFYLSTQFFDAAGDIPVLGWLIDIFKQFTALLVTWLLFVLLFTMMPNTKVLIRPAMVGALVSALAWELMKAGLRWYIESAVLSKTQSALYGSLALIPLTLFWIYLTWMVILAGLVVTHILQTLPANRMGRFERGRPAPAARDPWLVIPVMSAVSQAFDRGKTTSIEQIASTLEANPQTVGKMVAELEKRGLIHRLQDAEHGEGLSLAMPPSRIRIADLIATSPDEDHINNLPGHALLQQLAKAQDKALADLTLETPSKDVNDP